MIVETPIRTTTADFDAFVSRSENLERNFELIHGEIVEKMVSGPVSSRLGAKLLRYIGAFVDDHALGIYTGADGGYHVGDERYIPDVAYVSNARLNADVQKGYLTVTPDLAVEVISATDSAEAVRAKIAGYLAAGVLLWLADPVAQVIEVYAPGQPMRKFTRSMTLDGGTVLPGFTLALASVFPEGA